LAKKKKKKRVNAGSRPVPVVLSINVCDSIIRDERTKKVSLIGLFNMIKSNNFPCTHPAMHVHVAMTNGHGKYKTEIRLADLQGDEPIIGMIGELDFKSPLQVIEMGAAWRNINFQKPGEYGVQVLFNDAVVGTRKFRVVGPHENIPPTSRTEVK